MRPLSEGRDISEFLYHTRLEDLMEYRRLMEGAIRPKLERVDLSQLVTQQLFAYYDAFQRAGIDLEVDLSENLLLETDSDIFDRIVQNMLSNDYAPCSRSKESGYCYTESSSSMMRRPSSS